MEMWIYLLIIMGTAITTPFFILGVFRLKNIVSSMIKVNKGFIRVTTVLGNGRYYSEWVKPDGENVKVKGNKRKSIQFDQDRLIYDNGVPTLFYREGSTEAFDFRNEDYKPILDSSYFDDLIIRAFNSGRLSASTQEQLLLILVGASVLFGLLATASGIVNYMAISGLAG